MKHLIIATLFLYPTLAVAVEDRSTERRTFNAAQLIIVDNINGSIEVNGTGGNQVQLEVSKRIEAESPERLEAANREVKLDVQQSGDTLKLLVDGPFRCNCNDRSSRRAHEGYQVYYDFKLSVPASSRVDLYTVNHGQVIVRGVSGDFDVRNVNGRIEMTGMSGSGSAHTVNGGVKVAYTKNPAAESSFETVNGDIDVTLLPGLSSDVRVNTMHGGIYTDFDVSSVPAPVARESRDGKFVYRSGMSSLRIGSGGLPLRMKTLNGDIIIRARQ